VHHRYAAVVRVVQGSGDALYQLEVALTPSHSQGGAVMAKSSNQSTEQIQSSAPRSAGSAVDAPHADMPEPKLIQRVPFVWRLVFMILMVCFALMVLYEVSGYIGKLFR
jgi:hypothetical protein